MNPAFPPTEPWIGHVPPQPPALRTVDWIREGLRASVFRFPRAGSHPPTATQLVLLAVLTALIELALARLDVPGAARFDLRGWLVPWWTVAVMALLLWSLLEPARGDMPVQQPRGVPAWFALWLVASIPPVVVNHALSIAEAREALPAAFEESQLLSWGVFLALNAWSIGIEIRLGFAFGLRRLRLAVFAAGMLVIYGVSLWQFGDRPWEARREAGAERPRFTLSQETFEVQQAVWRKAVGDLTLQREGVVDVYGIVFAPYAHEDVFLRESILVSGVLADRFEARGRVLQLVNHATTAATLPWATPLNLQRAIEAVAKRMDREQDVLVLYLTSHGASNFRLSAEHWPLQVPWLRPEDLRKALDEAGIRHRVIAVSACYSGGWVGPLAGESTLVMTAADAQNTSYGCGRKSELTFFGRALFDEQLRRTHSFEEAFAAAVPVIRRREQEAGKPDGFSNPQISVGDRIRPVLGALAQRLDAEQPASK